MIPRNGAVLARSISSNRAAINKMVAVWYDWILLILNDLHTEDSTKVEAHCDRLSLLRTSNIPNTLLLYSFTERLILSVIYINLYYIYTLIKNEANYESLLQAISLKYK